MTVPRHLRDNHDNTDEAMIRFNGLAYALEIVGDEIPEGATKAASHWQAFYALLNELIDKHETIMRMRSLEWIGMGGNSTGESFTEAEIAKARGN